MGANCVSDGRRICQNDLQQSVNISNQPIKMSEQSVYKEDLDMKDLVMQKKSKVKDNKFLKGGSFEETDESLLKNEDLQEFEKVGDFPKQYIAATKDVNFNQYIKDYILESDVKSLLGQKGQKLQDMKQLQGLYYQHYQNGTYTRRIIIQQPFMVIKKPPLGNIVQHIKIIPKEGLYSSYNLSKEHQNHQMLNKMNTSQDIPSSTRSNSSSFLNNSASKMRKLTIYLNQHNIADENMLIQLLSAKQHHVSIRLTHEKQKDVLDKFLSRIDCKRLSLEINNVPVHINPVYIHNLNTLKLNLQGFNCSSGNYEFQESLFYFFCSNSSQIRTLKLKTRECSIDHFFHLLENEICEKGASNLTKISLDLVFFGSFQNDVNLLIDIENLIKTAVWINKWNLALRFKQRVTCQLAGEFENNSHGSLSESYLLTQPKESMIYKPIDQSSFLSPIIKPRDYSPHNQVGKQASFDKKRQTIVTVPENSKQSNSQIRKPSSLKKLSKTNNNLHSMYQSSNQNKPMLMLMQEIKEQNSNQLEADRSFNSYQESSMNGNIQPPKSPERLNTVTFANNNELPYSVVKQLDQSHHHQIVQTRQRNKSNFLDSSISVGIDLINEKPLEETLSQLQQLQQMQITKILKLISNKKVRKLYFIDQSGKVNTQDLLSIIQQFNTIQNLSISITIFEDNQIYSLQNIIRNNSSTLKTLTLILEKKAIISVFDDQRLFGQIEKLPELKQFIINYQTMDFIPKYILKMKNLLYFRDLYKHKVSLNKFNPFLNNENNNNNSNKNKTILNKYKNQNNFNQLISLLQQTKLVTLKSNQLQNNIPDTILNALTQHILTQKTICYQFCILRNFKIKHTKVYLDLSTFYV